MSTPYEVITYKDIVSINYILPGNETKEKIEREIILIWEGTLEKFLEAFTPPKPYTVETFESEKEKERFLAFIEKESDEVMDEVQAEIARKMEYPLDYTSPTYKD